MENTKGSNVLNKETKGMKHLLQDIERRTRIIRSARIEAAKRNKRKDNFYKTVLIVYTVIITVLSVRFGITEISKSGQTLSINLLASSVYLTLFTMYIAQKNYSEKVSKYQTNYMELTRLLSEIQKTNAIEHFDIEKYHAAYTSFSDEYSSLLTQSDNHDDIDYHRAVLREDKDNEYKRILAIQEEKKHQRIEWFKKGAIILSLPLILVLIKVIEVLV